MSLTLRSPIELPSGVRPAARQLRHLLRFPGSDVLARESYRLVLRRAIDRGALIRWRRELGRSRGRLVPLVNSLFLSPEYVDMVGRSPLAIEVMNNHLHIERCRLVRSLPPARVIVDLGGAAPGDPRGALMVMGLRHPFESLTIVDVPPGASLEQSRTAQSFERVETDLGPVSYVYRDMKDAGELQLEAGSVDLVWMGESVEHISEAEFDGILPWIQRSLRPGGLLCIDTPNRAVTRLQSPDRLIHPDHKLEYEASQLRAKLEGAGLTVELEAGIGRADEGLRAGRFDPGEVIWKSPLNPHASESYLLVFVASKPPTGPR